MISDSGIGVSRSKRAIFGWIGPLRESAFGASYPFFMSFRLVASLAWRHVSGIPTGLTGTQFIKESGFRAHFLVYCGSV